MSLPLSAPIRPLVATPVRLDRYPGDWPVLRQRMAEVFGVASGQALPIRGVTHGLELAFRWAAREGIAVDAPDDAPYQRLRKIYATPSRDAADGVVIRRDAALSEIIDQARPARDILFVVDAGLADFADAPLPVVPFIEVPNLIVLRSLSLAYGLAGARVGAALGAAEALARLDDVMEPFALPSPSVDLALKVLDPSRIHATLDAIASVREERRRVAGALSNLMDARPEAGPTVLVRPADPVETASRLALYGIEGEWRGDDLRLPVSSQATTNDRLLLALGAPTTGRLERLGECVRDTNETRIVCQVSLDRSAPVHIRTGVGFYDHMLEQIAAHAGISVRLSCDGDLHTDGHHTIEDSAIALGRALDQALGDRAGLGRFGFALPMDDAQAQVVLDLAGRPFAVFEGDFASPFIGDYRTELTQHVFRSLADSLRAAIHVRVTGKDDHHKTEACFKAFGRALRQAVRVEGDAVPSTKGVL